LNSDRIKRALVKPYILAIQHRIQYFRRAGYLIISQNQNRRIAEDDIKLQFVAFHFATIDYCNK